MAKNEEKDINFLEVTDIVEVKESAVAISKVAGTTQDGRLAVLNASNQSIFLSSGGNSLLRGSGLFIKGRAIQEGETYQVSDTLYESHDNSELDIETVWIQNDDAAEAVLSLIVKSFETRYKEINISLFGNPLVQIGDFVKVSYQTGKISFSSDDYWLVVGVTHSFSEGLKTDLILKPVKKIFGDKVVSP